MKIAVTGAKGQLGSRLVSLGAEPLLCDVTDAGWVKSEVERVLPDIIIHLAAMTSVDWCEKNYDQATLVNVRGTNIVCEESAKIIGNGMVCVISTDQVFNGKRGPYREGDRPDPINCYGFTKYGAEAVAQIYDCKVVRISRCIDCASKDVCEYMRLLGLNQEIRVPDHLYRSYTHLDFMAESLWHYANRYFEMPAVLHVAGSEAVSFYHLMSALAYEFGIGKSLVRPRGEEAGYTPRPARVGLDVSLASSLGVPIYSIGDVVRKIAHEG